MGDVAMMQVAVTRLQELWPSADIEVLTSCPEQLLRFCPSVTPFSVESRNVWLSGRSLISGVFQKMPSETSILLHRLERQLWLRFPGVTEIEVCLKAAILRRPKLSPSGFRKRLVGADLLVLSGAGVTNDAFADQAYPLLDEMEFVLRAGIPVVAFGRGIGPIANPALLARVRDVFPRLKLIGLREAHTGLPLLESLGVTRDRICVTGDDAIELAFRRRPSSLGKGIGVNLRVADYAEMGSEMIGKLREPLRLAARKLNSAFIPIPISLNKADSDLVSIESLLGRESSSPQKAIKSPEDVIRLVAGCRVVVTGSYHGGVFALAQGIPVVGLVRSPYYEQKFSGLQEQFPRGCQILDFRQHVTSDEIQAAICNAWDSAEPLREPLLAAAARQVKLGSAAYQAARNLFPLNPAD